MSPSPHETPYSPSDENVFDTLVTASFVVTAMMTRLGAAHDLSLTLVRVLGILADAPRRVSDLAAHLGLEKQTLSGLITRAAQRDLVERVSNEDDRRTVVVKLTSTGSRLIAQLKDEGRTELSPALAALDQHDRSELDRLLARVLRPAQMQDVATTRGSSTHR